MKKGDDLAVLQAEVETIVKRLKVTNEPGERRILLTELRQILDKLGREANPPRPKR
jgi:hypothetical protein